MATMHGLSLVELMVALAISTLIMIVLVQIFAGSKSTYQMDEGLARLQENGRFALDFLEYDIRQAGNKGCRGYISQQTALDKVFNHLNTSPGDLTVSVLGYETNGTTPGSSFTLPGSLYSTPPLTTATSPPLDAAVVPVAGVVSGSDILVLRFMDPVNSSDLVQDSTRAVADSLNVHASPTAPIKVGDILMTSDCQFTYIFNATAITPASSGGINWLNVAHTAGPGPTDNTVSAWPEYDTHKLGDNAQLSQMRTVVYYIGPGSYGGPSLFRVDSLSGVPQELVEGVENMQVLYGVDTQQGRTSPYSISQFNTTQYVPASGISTAPSVPPTPDWWHVLSVRVALLVSTSNVSGQADAAFDTTAAYPVNGVSVAPPASDRHRRRVFSVTVNLRNHVLKYD